jgi:hypothetical protein
MMRVARLVLLLVLVACGGTPTRTLPNGVPVAVIDQSCPTRLKPLYDALREMDSRLSVGMGKADYTSRLGDVRVKYDAVTGEGDFPAGACFDTAVKLQDATNGHLYFMTAGAWVQKV